MKSAQTLVEKILSTHCDASEVAPGQTIEVEPDVLFFYGSSLLDTFGRTNNLTCPDPRRVVVALDQNVGDLTQQGGPEGRTRLRDLVKSCGISHFYDHGRGGVPSVLFTDLGFVRPGGLVAGMDQHMAALGALGVFPLALDREPLLRAFSGERVDVLVPATIRVLLTGTPNRWVRGDDIGFFLLDLLEPDEVRGRVVELAGEGLEGIDLPDRLSLVASLHSLGAAAVLIEPDERTRIYVRARSSRGFPLMKSDEDAVFAGQVEVNLVNVRPRILLGQPGGGSRNVALSKVKEEPVQQVVLGACGGGRIEDLRAAAGFLREYMVSPDVRLVVIPGSQQVLLHAMEEGLIQIFVRAGGHVGLPSCSYASNCRKAAVQAGEHCLSSGTCPGDEWDHGKGRLSFCNPVVAAVSAVMGEIVSPLDLVKRRKRMSTGIQR